ncbi:hypothetical protein F5883DRAFT_581973 [Diaporthe sp. PMI_573]|nr:hypothetical protein F5883DRAFT_581973 [Diaporthaceae sp. PMI_573]
MARRRYRPDDSDDDSDGSNYSDHANDVSSSDEASEDGDEVFDVDVNDAGSETNLTDIDDFCEDVDDIDVEDAAQLVEGNLHPREYYIQGMQEFNEAAFDDEDYSEGSTRLLDAIEEQWNQYTTSETALASLGLCQ